MGVKKLVQDGKLRLATWNRGTLSGKGMELVDTMIKGGLIQHDYKKQSG